MTNNAILEFAGLTDIGQARSHNEDAIEICEERSFAILADGMGGYNAGEVASQMSVNIVKKYLLHKYETSWLPRFAWQTLIPTLWINEAITEANTKVLSYGNGNIENKGMGTTIVVALCYYDKLVIGHVGDSRVYRFRKNSLTQITHDHSVVQSQIDSGLISQEDAYYSPIKNLITRAVGTYDEIDVEIKHHAMQQEDIYLLCSDGLSDMVNQLQIEQILQQHSNNLKTCCEILIKNANERGGFDNISVILFRVKELQERGLMESIFAS